MFNKTVLFSCLFSICQSKFYDSISNVTDYNECKIYHDHGDYYYQYTEFYELTNSSEPNPDSILDFHFSINASSNVHILLASYSGGKISDTVYEIAIGVGDYSLVDIRKIQRDEEMRDFNKTIKGVLPKLRLQSFWIHISINGAIKFGREGNDRPLVSWTDPDQNPLHVKIISFSTMFKNESTFYFDCPTDDATEQSAVLIPSTFKLAESALWLLPFPPDSSPKTTLASFSDTQIFTVPSSNQIISNSAHKTTIYFGIAIPALFYYYELRIFNL